MEKAMSVRRAEKARAALMAALEQAGLPTVPPAVATVTDRPRRGIIYDRWPFRLDISTEYQDWILVAACFLIVGVWCLPCVCGTLRNRCSKAFTRMVYMHMHTFYCVSVYFTLFTVMFTVGILPDWTVDQFIEYLGHFFAWVLKHLVQCLICVLIILVFVLALKFRDRLLLASGIEHITFFRFSLSDLLGTGRKRPVEFFIWKVEDLVSSSGKMMKPNDVYIECHMGYNETMRTRVHNNAGSSCVIQESFQMNIDEAESSTLLTIIVKDQTWVASAELGRLMLSTREMCGIEDQTGKRRLSMEYDESCFVALELVPRGKIWIALKPVDDTDDPDDRGPGNDDDNLLMC
mmetsp:Transcript_36246/g.107680  ORF Transcript_36246/g.107680 Transcript_36246/m.107680 type:complete len:348 (+) Transcript_36246:98-1141(+)